MQHSFRFAGERGRTHCRVLCLSACDLLIFVSAVSQSQPGIAFCHIPKTGGTSLRLDLAKLGINITTREGCMLTLSMLPRAQLGSITLLRPPREHVLSQYLQCRHEGFRLTQGHLVDGKPFPGSGYNRRGASSEDIMRDFDAWVDVFASNQTRQGPDADFNCYNPVNMMTRYLTCTGNNPHHWFQFMHVSLSSAIETMHKVKVLGLTEFYAETLCLIQFMFTGKVETSCMCDSKERMPTTHFDHGVANHDVRNISEETATKIDAFTALDRQLYHVGALQFLHDTARMESALQSTVLCPEKRRTLLEQLYPSDG